MNFSTTDKLMPREEMLEVLKSKKNFSIGIPKESELHENRIALVPNAVSQLIRHGHKVIIERDAGLAAHFPNEEYAEAGAVIAESKQEIFECDIVLKIAPPDQEELELVRKNQIIISSLQIKTRDKSYFNTLISKKVTSIAFELIKDEAGSCPVLQAMGEIVGKAIIFIAAEYQSNPEFGKGNLVGGLPGVPSSEVVIIGAGTVGENAAATALSLGAQVKVFDNKIYKLRKLLNFVSKPVYTSVMQPKILHKALKTADIVIGSYYMNETQTDCIITREMVASMKYGSIIIDVSIDQGGCFETSKITTHTKPVFKKYDVTHYCVPNIASKYAHTASYALSNFFTPLMLRIGNEGGVRNMLRLHSGLGKGVYLYQGILTKKHIGDQFDLPSKDIDLILAAF